MLSSQDQGTTDYIGTPTGALKPVISIKKSRRPKFVSNKFSVSIKNSSGITAASNYAESFQMSSKGWLVQAF